MSSGVTGLTELNAFVHGFHVANNPSHYKPALPDEVAAWFRGLFENRAVRIWIAEEARTQYTLGYLSHESIYDGKYRSIDVRVSRPGLEVIAKRGYYPSAQDTK